MSSLGVRPRFSQTLELDLETAQSSIIREVGKGDAPCEVKSFPGFIILRIPEADRHFWSPRLNLSLDAAEDGTTRIEGIYGPNANVWALFLFGYLIIGSLALFSGTLAFAQWSLDSPAWGVWIFGFFMALLIGLYIAARCGRNIGAPQTSELHHIYEAAIGRTVEVR